MPGDEWMIERYSFHALSLAGKAAESVRMSSFPRLSWVASRWARLR